MKRQAFWVALYAVAMAAVESAVVVYLRALHPGDEPVSVLLVVIPDRILTVELGRELGTIAMLLAVGVLAGRTRWERFLWFSFAFGAWDIFYYVWLWVFIQWPPSLLTWDVLFLIPVPWVGPVLAPVIVSMGLVGGSLWLLSRPDVRLSRTAWGAMVAGAIVILVSFTLDYHYVLARTDPPMFRWWLFLAGFGAGLGALVVTMRRAIARGVPPGE